MFSLKPFDNGFTLPYSPLTMKARGIRLPHQQSVQHKYIPIHMYQGGIMGEENMCVTVKVRERENKEQHEHTDR